ncbi:sulfotransferase [Psychrosphaera sp. F3M07]|uniref:sulfotransferase n=1 Tax=Psychrosphaera sp. F3M07 TaxID=2841560 RepID=UPI001C083C4B|nr:sulfotransferase [Psychrosphaera sp. F3M07]MBU2917115.1 sulfotransferase [Psychrosphaera sp. F3M07]
MNEVKEAEAVILQLYAKYEAHTWFKILVASLALANKDYNEVIKLLTGQKQDSISNWFHPQLLHIKLLAQAHEKLGNYDISFELFNKLAKFNLEKHNFTDRIDQIKQYDSIYLKDLKRTEYTQQSIVFMIGFPRSGSTLLETMLGTHHSIVTLSEPLTISKVIESAKNITNQDYPKCLTKLNTTELIHLKKVYFDEVEKIIGDTYKGKVLIDKMPLNIGHLP